MLIRPTPCFSGSSWLRARWNSGDADHGLWSGILLWDLFLDPAYSEYENIGICVARLQFADGGEYDYYLRVLHEQCNSHLARAHPNPRCDRDHHHQHLASSRSWSSWNDLSSPRQIKAVNLWSFHQNTLSLWVAGICWAVAAAAVMTMIMINIF